MDFLSSINEITSAVITQGVSYAKDYVEGQCKQVNTAIAFSNLAKIVTIGFSIWALKERTPESFAITGATLAAHLYIGKKIDVPIQLLKSFGVLEGGESSWGLRERVTLVDLEKKLHDVENASKAVAKSLIGGFFR